MTAPLSISRLEAWPSEADAWVAVTSPENFRGVVRLREGWLDGSNRFAQQGEGLFAARQRSELVALCGLNRDPFTTVEGVGRLRHLYVSPAHRRCGVGSALVRAILIHAKAHFRTVRLRTDSAEASGFYAALGFSRTHADPDATHQLLLGP